jgi:hypothetical protein
MAGPSRGLTEVTVGGRSKVNRTERLTGVVPVVVVTVTSTLPGGSCGDVTVIELFETVRKAAGTVPKSTAVTSTKSDPVMVTVVPPNVDPVVGLMPVTTNGGVT